MKLREAGLCKKKNVFSDSRKLFFPHCSCETQRSPALQKNNFSGSKKLFFPHCSCETQTSPAFQKKIFFQALFFFARYSLELREARLCKKSQALKKCFFPHCSYETQTSPALQKTFFQALNGPIFFRMPLVKSANSTSLPRLSSLQIAQMRAIHN